MKSLRNMTLLPLVALALVGCDPAKEDRLLIEELDHTAPAYVMFAQSMKAISAASGSVIGALNFNEWLTAADEESRLVVEDKYYTYDKIREREENLWDIYTSSSSERYFLREGLPLSSEGAVWEARKHPLFFRTTESVAAPTISRLAEESFGVAFDGVPTVVWLYSHDTLYEYLRSWDRESYTAALTTNLEIATNNLEFRAGDSPNLNLTVSGEGSLYDYGEGFVVEFEITDPLRLCFTDDGMIAGNRAIVGAMRVSNNLGEWAEVTMTPYNAVVVNFHPKEGGDFVGYYDVMGNSITPK